MRVLCCSLGPPVLAPAVPIASEVRLCSYLCLERVFIKLLRCRSTASLPGSRHVGACPVHPLKPPVFDQSLVGKEIEVLWKYHHNVTNEPMYIWSPGLTTTTSSSSSHATTTV